MDYDWILADLPNERIRATVLLEPPGHRTKQISHFAEEIYFVPNGSLVIEIEDQVYESNEGVSVHFESTRQHLSWKPPSHVRS